MRNWIIKEGENLLKLLVTTRTIPFTKERFFHTYQQLAAEYEHHVLLESGRGGRYSIAAFAPERIYTGLNHTLSVQTETETTVLHGNPLHLLQEQLAHYHVPHREELPDFQGGVIGYISYDYARYIEKLPSLAEDDLRMPELYFLQFKNWFVFDEDTNLLWIMELGEEGGVGSLTEWETRWLSDPSKTSAPRKESQGLREPNPKVSMSDEEFMAAVQKIQNYIAAGDIFQVNLSVRQSEAIDVPAMAVYEELRKLNPSPYMSFIHTPEFQIVSGSPELLVKKKEKVVSTRPIAGTRSRGQDEAEDVRLAAELIENEKERAEHVMLVDLERNDLGRVCRYGTVEVNEFMTIEKYSHVMHIVSNVRGIIEEQKTAFDLIDATFPGGTITGAPKVRTMEIIEELEPVRRGIYTGSIGWIGFDGDAELNIVIRTMLVKNGQAHIQAGAGIVIDSNPKHEYKESLKKARALWKAKELAERNNTDDSNDR